MNETVVKLLLAVLVGGLIGAEREVRVGVGLRTMMLICLGAAMFTIFSEVFAVGQGDPLHYAVTISTIFSTTSCIFSVLITPAR